MKDIILNSLKENLLVHETFLNNQENIDLICLVSDRMIQALKTGGKILFCGNGGSAADSQHLSAELSGRFKLDRKPLDSEALHVNTSYITAVGNDYGYEEIFSRLVESRGRKGDVLIGLSTSGNSANVVKAMEKAKDLNMITVSLTGSKTSLLEKVCDYTIKVPSEDTARIQECHIMIGHIICEIVESEMVKNEN